MSAMQLIQFVIVLNTRLCSTKSEGRRKGTLICAYCNNLLIQAWA